MFVTFSFQKRIEPESRWQALRLRLLERLCPPRTTIARIPLYDSFFTDIRIGARLCQDVQQERQLRQCGRFALCAEGCPMPEGFLPAVSPADIRQLTARLLCGAATKILSLSALPLYCRCVALIDPPCAYGGLLEQLVKYTPELIIYTENQKAYEGYAQRLMEQYGAPVQFISDPRALSRACLILDTGGIPLPPLRPIPILSVSQAVRDTNLRLCQPLWQPGPADAVLPPGIDRYAFLTALSVRCRVRELGALPVCSLLCRDRRSDITEAAAQIARNQSEALRVR